MQLSKIRQDHKHLLEEEDQPDGAWLDKVFAAIDDMTAGFCNSFKIPADKTSLSAVASCVTTQYETQSLLIQQIDQKVDGMLSKSAVPSEPDLAADILQKIDKLFAAREHISEGTKDAGSKHSEMIDIFNKLFPTEGAMIGKSDDAETIRSKIDAAIKATHQQLAATDSADPEERKKALEAAKENLASPEQTEINRIEAVVDFDSRWLTPAHEL